MFPLDFGMSSVGSFHIFSNQRGVFLMQVNLNFLKTVEFKNTDNGICTCLSGYVCWEHNTCVTQSLQSLWIVAKRLCVWILRNIHDGSFFRLNCIQIKPFRFPVADLIEDAQREYEIDCVFVPIVTGYQRLFSPGVKWPSREAEGSPPSNDKVKNG